MRISRDLRNMEIHGLIALLASVVLDKAGATTLDLDAAASLLLNVLNIGATVADNLSTKVETRDRFEVDRNLFFGPFTLKRVSVSPVLPQYVTLCKLPFHTHPVQLVQAPCDGSVSHRRD